MCHFRVEVLLASIDGLEAARLRRNVLDGAPSEGSHARPRPGRIARECALGPFSSRTVLDCDIGWIAWGDVAWSATRPWP